jgi:periplasmic protein TonB
MARNTGSSGYYMQPALDFSNRAVLVAALVLIHALVIYLAARQTLDPRGHEEAAVLDVRDIPLKKDPIAPPPLPQVTLRERWPIQVAPLEIVLDTPDEPPPIQALDENRSPPESHATAMGTGQPQESVLGPLTAPRPISWPRGADRYPPQSVLAQESGKVWMTICISSTGTVDSVTLAKSSGFPRLDQAALGIASEYRFQPAKRRGTPVPACVLYALRFRIGKGPV